MPLDAHDVAARRGAVLPKERGQRLEEALRDKVLRGDEGDQVGDQLVMQGRGVGEDARVVFDGEGEPDIAGGKCQSVSGLVVMRGGRTGGKGDVTRNSLQLRRDVVLKGHLGHGRHLDRVQDLGEGEPLVVGRGPLDASDVGVRVATTTLLKSGM